MKRSDIRATAAQQRYLRERLSQKMRKLDNQKTKSFRVLLDTSKLKIPKTLGVTVHVDSWTGAIKIPSTGSLEVDVRRAMKSKEVQDRIDKLKKAKAAKKLAHTRAVRIRDRIELGEGTPRALFKEIDGLGL